MEQARQRQALGALAMTQGSYPPKWADPLDVEAWRTIRRLAQDMLNRAKDRRVVRSLRTKSGALRYPVWIEGCGFVGRKSLCGFVGRKSLCGWSWRPDDAPTKGTAEEQPHAHEMLGDGMCGECVTLAAMAGVLRGAK